MKNGLCLLTAGLCLAFAGVPSSLRAEVKVVTTLPSLASLASEVGGEHVHVEALASASEDPHFVDARPNLMLKLNRADLLIVNGLELEVGWLPTLQNSARNPKILVGASGYLDASQYVKLLEVPTRKIDRSMGDIHPGGNPHFLFDPRAAAAITLAIGGQLAELDPANGADYRSRASGFAAKLQQFAEEQRSRFAALTPEQRRVVSYHASMQYLIDWLQLEEVATIEPKPGIPPDPGHVAKVLQTMRATKTRVIIQEQFYPTRTSETIVKMVEGKLVVIHGGAQFQEGEKYLAHLRVLTQDLYAALTGST